MERVVEEEVDDVGVAAAADVDDDSWDGLLRKPTGVEAAEVVAVTEAAEGSGRAATGGVRKALALSHVPVAATAHGEDEVMSVRHDVNARPPPQPLLPAASRAAVSEGMRMRVCAAGPLEGALVEVLFVQGDLVGVCVVGTDKPYMCPRSYLATLDSGGGTAKSA